MSFGWSAGDCFTAVNLIIEVFSSLKDSGGSRSEFQELLRELKGLKVALQHVDNLQERSNTPSSKLTELKSIALACQVPLEEFFLKVNKYDKGLGSHSPKRRRIIQNTTRKIQWLGMKDDVYKLQHYLNTHIGTINILLAEYQLDLLSLASEQAFNNKLDIQSHLRATQDAIDATKASASVDKQDIELHLQKIQDEISSNTQNIECHLSHIRGAIDSTASKIIEATADVESQTIAVRHNTSLLEKVLGAVRGNLGTFWMPVINILANVRTTTEQIYTIVLEIRSSLAGPDPRFTWYQVPVKVEDALGRIFPVPSEYSFSELEGIIQMKFANSSCHEEVIARNYELSNRKNSKHILTGDDSVALLPGMSIVMAIIIDRPLTPTICPMPQCGSTDTAAAQWGGRECLECAVWFDGANKKRKQEEINSDSDSLSDERHSKKRMFDQDSVKRPKGITTNYEVFKNVRCVQLRRRGRAAPPGRCHSCNRTETREWRRGPDGARTICNTCGLHYAKLRKFNKGVHAQTKQFEYVDNLSIKQNGNKKQSILSWVLADGEPNDVFDADEVGLQDSPLLKPRKPILQPTPSPLPELPESEDSPPPRSPKRRKAFRRLKPVLSQGDAVLINLLGKGKALGVARTAAAELLASGGGMSDELQKV